MTRWLRLLTLLLLATASSVPQLVIPPVTAECATSIDGSVVGVSNPLNPPIVAAQFSGTLPAGNYYVQIVWYDALSNVTLASPEVAVQLTGMGEIQVSPPASGMPATAVGSQVFVGTSSGSETYQGTVVGSAVYTQSVPLSAGAALPTTNTTVCQIIANDAGWPSGTGYNVSLTDPAGATMPGYPMQWQLLGPGNTINLGNGLPQYNGTVTYPIPILSRPYGHGPQSISGPLSMTTYNLTNVGLLGVGTGVPAWGVDVEGSSNAGIVNANSGYLVNGTAPAADTCLGSLDGVANDAQLPCIASLPTIYYQFVFGNGGSSPQEPGLNIIGATCVDNAGQNRTDCTISATSIGGTPTLTGSTSGAGTPLGVGGSVVLAAGSTDKQGEVAAFVGTSPGTTGSLIWTLLFSHAYSNITCVFSQASGPPIAALLTNGLPGTSLSLNGTAFAGSTTYQWNYVCVGQ
jgi:hypothetical protein